MSVEIGYGTKTCADWDCRKPARRNGFFCSDACRARTWRRNHPGYQSPPGEHARQNAAERPSRVSVGGLQVSYRKVLAALQGPPLYVTETTARRVVDRCLSDLQRERLEAKS